MKLKDIYAFFIQEGIKADLRKKGQIKSYFSTQRKAFRKLKVSQQKYFDKEVFRNPYADTRILAGDLDGEVKRILVGIDIDVGEIMLADHLSSSSKKIDLVLAHHPEGVALAGLAEVMELQADLLTNLGVDSKIARDLMKKRMSEVSRHVHGSNHSKVVDAARLLNVPFMCCHTAADNHVTGYLQRLIDKKKPKNLQGLVDLLLKEPEYKLAAKEKAGPTILVGKPKDEAGKVFVDMTGGTSGSKDIYPRLSQLGIKTQLAMHLSDSHFDKIKAEYMQTVVAGHMASDSLGLNLLLDKLQKKAKIEIVECSGFRRIRRKS